MSNRYARRHPEPWRNRSLKVSRERIAGEMRRILCHAHRQPGCSCCESPISGRSCCRNMPSCPSRPEDALWDQMEIVLEQSADTNTSQPPWPRCSGRSAKPPTPIREVPARSTRTPLEAGATRAERNDLAAAPCLDPPPCPAGTLAPTATIADPQVDPGIAGPCPGPRSGDRWPRPGNPLLPTATAAATRSRSTPRPDRWPRSAPVRHSHRSAFQLRCSRMCGTPNWSSRFTVLQEALAWAQQRWKQMCPHD